MLRGVDVGYCSRVLQKVNNPTLRGVIGCTSFRAISRDLMQFSTDLRSMWHHTRTDTLQNLKFYQLRCTWLI